MAAADQRTEMLVRQSFISPFFPEHSFFVLSNFLAVPSSFPTQISSDQLPSFLIFCTKIAILKKLTITD